MTYTILAAAYANAEHTAAILTTAEAGAVVASLDDTPELWTAMLASVDPDPFKASTPPIRYIPVATLRERLETLGKWEDFTSRLTNSQLLKLATLRLGVAPDDPDMLALLEAAEVNVPAILDGFI